MTRYELLDRIGVGGMAEIFRGKAVAAGGFEKPVAIKRILPHLSQDKRFVELLIAEAKVLSLLKHRNIVQIFDVGLGDDAQYFLVMEYVDGKDLGAVQRGLEASRRRMPFDLALHIGAEICEALEHAHAAKTPDGKPMTLVHRDVSPSNVLLSRAGEIKLTDFGIAKRAEQEQTGHGAVRGKFAYISPEQARNEHIDPRSDVFSVGILLWELITNRRLFSKLGDLEALRAVREAKVPRPTEVDPRLDPQIDAVLLAALARDAAARPTAGQLGATLRSLRYSLEVTVGDPATELAKVIDNAVEVERRSQQLSAPAFNPRGRPSLSFGGEAEHTEATVIRIRTADAFSTRDKDVAAARQVIDRFEEEETRLAQLSGDQVRKLRSRRDSADLASPVSPPPPALPGLGPRAGRRGARPPTSRPWRARRSATRRPRPTPRSHRRAASRPPTTPSTRRRARGSSRRAIAAHPSRCAAQPAGAPADTPPAPPPPPRPRRSGPAPPAPPVAPPIAAPPGAAEDWAPGTVDIRAGVPGVAPPIAAAAPPAPMPMPMHSPLQPPLQPPMPPQMQPPMPPQMQPPMPPMHPPAPMSAGYPNAGYPTWNQHMDPHGIYGRSPPGPAPLPSASYASLGPRKPVLKPWVLAVGALLMALLAFAVTRALL